MQYPSDRNGPVKPITQVKTRIEVELVRVVLTQHGCRIEGQGPECTVLFPEGTTRQELYPRTYESRFRILLPDGFELRMTETRTGKNWLSIIIDNPKQ